MAPAVGILTSRGGSSSHAAVVARQMGKPCIAGAEEIDIDVADQTLTANGTTLHEGDWISLDGTTGEVFAGRIATIEPDFKRETELITLLSWADDDAHDGRLGQRRHARRGHARARRSAPAASAWCAPSTCSARKAARRSCRT